jgi:geranylgeranyl diphosphate synthase type II
MGISKFITPKTPLIFKELKFKIEKAIKNEILEMNAENALKDAIEYSLLNGGKRYRPIFVLLISQILNKNLDSMYAGLCVEFLHTASLIADDLPSMDNELLRRDKKSLHLKFNEANAILASYSLISLAYEMIIKNKKVLEKTVSKEKANEICVIAIEMISKYAGVNGATLGQHLDLFSSDFSIDNINRIIKLKTISLFEISFVLGWLFGLGDLDKLDIVKNAAYNFGMAFQIKDDLDDFEEDLKKEKKINIAIALGKEKAQMSLDESVLNFEKALKELNLYTESFKYLIKKLQIF